MIVSRMTMEEFSRALANTRVAVVPLGSTEEHGGHLPLDTDTLQVVRTAELALEEVPFFLCPPLHYGYCRSTADHPGTLSISPDTLRGLVFDIGASLHHQGIRGVFFLSGHAGGIHMAAVEEAAERLLASFPEMEVAVACEYHWAREAGEGLVATSDDGHAGEIETSRVSAVDPSLVKGTSPEEYPRFEKPFLAREKRPQWPGGVWGNPAAADEGKGHKLYERTAKRLADLVRRMEERIGERLSRATKT